MKRCISVLFLTALFFCVRIPARASQEASVSSRISFYYQYEGGARSVEGFWDRMLSDRLLALYGHDQIYPYSDKYLTGRGCCLFSFSHAYQYLCGYAGTAEAKADILYRFLSQKPVWSNTGSSMSPPNAASYYAAYLKKQPGVALYTGALDTYSRLSSFFNGSKSVVIINVPGHYVIGVGCTRYNGVEYVHIVDSLLSATIKTGRLSRGMSMDFSVTFTPANAGSYQAAVHEYWVPYSQIASSCKLKYAFRTGGTPAPFKPEALKNELLLTVGASENIEFTNTDEVMAFSSLDENICTVDEYGCVIAVSPGATKINCVSLTNSAHYLTIPVWCIRADHDQFCLIRPGEPDPEICLEGQLPDGASIVVFSEESPFSSVRILLMQVLDTYGEAVCDVRLTVAELDQNEMIILGGEISSIETEAFSGGAYKAVSIPSSVKRVESLAFADSDIQAVFVESADTEIAPDAFGARTPLICYNYGAFLSWFQRNENDP